MYYTFEFLYEDPLEHQAKSLQFSAQSDYEATEMFRKWYSLSFPDHQIPDDIPCRVVYSKDDAEYYESIGQKYCRYNPNEGVCEYPEGMTMAVQTDTGLVEIDPCVYEEIERHENVTVIVSRCIHCGNIDISWVEEGENEEDYSDDQQSEI